MASEDSKDERAQGEDENVRARLQGIVADMLKKTFSAGIGAVFTTEEGIRKLVGEFSLPKDVTSFLIGQAQGTRDEVLRILTGEFRKWLDRVDVQKELTRILTALSLEVKTEVRFIPSDKSIVKPEIKRKVTVKRAEPREPREEDAPPSEPTPDGSGEPRGD